LFGEFSRGKRLKSLDRVVGDLALVTAGENNNGISAYIGNDVEVFPANTISIDMFGSVKYRNHEYAADDNIAIVHTENLSQNTVLFITIILRKLLYNGHFSYARQFRLKADEVDIKLPITPQGKIDFAFMENFIEELEAYHIEELEAYLLATGLKDYNLNKDETEALDRFASLVNLSSYEMGGGFKLFSLDELFESENGNFDIQKSHINDKGLYVITAGLSNNGILGKSDIKAKVFPENSITVDMFGNTFYRQFKYKMVTHARVFCLMPNFEITTNQGLFLANSLHFLNKKFGYENMCSFAKIKDTEIILPITSDNKIDFKLMENFISAISKLVIKDVVLYANAKIQATQKAISN